MKRKDAKAKRALCAEAPSEPDRPSCVQVPGAPERPSYAETLCKADSGLDPAACKAARKGPAADVGRNLAVDAAALAAYLLAANPALTGIGIHEWAGLGLVVVFLVHAALHLDWATDTLRGFRFASWSRRAHFALDAGVLVAFAAVTVSGFMISGAVLPACSLYAPGYYLWDPLHAVAAKVLLALLVVHLVGHIRWVAGAIKRKPSVFSDSKR